jgi:PEGA domain
MVHRSRVLVGLVFLATIGLASPPDAAAQRAVPRGGGGHPTGGGGRPSGGGGHSTGVAVPRAVPPNGYRPYYGSHYYGYGYPRYYYPYAYAGYYYPYYSGFSFSVGFGWPAPYYAYPSYAYPYTYPYPYAYPYPDYRPDHTAPTRVEVSSAVAQPIGFGTLSIRTIPADAVILVDGERWDRPEGDTRFSIELANGVHQVEVRKEGFHPYVRTVDIPGGRTFVLNVSLTD